jgi:phosphoglycolate phosphatase
MSEATRPDRRPVTGRTPAGPVRLFVFDLDGTLIDSRKDLADSANATLHAYGLAPLPDAAVVGMVGEGARVLVERVFAAHATTPPEGALETFIRLYGERLFVHTRPYAGVPEMLATVSRSAAVAVLSNKPQEPSERLVAHFGFAPHVFRVIGGDAAFPRKPDPAALRALMAEATASERETILVGDSWVDHETAARAGVRIVLARYGFGFGQIAPDRLRGDEWFVDGAEEIVAIVSG